MLEPDDRLTLLDSLRPPPGFTLDIAVGTTFTLHLDALLTAPAAFALFDVGGERTTSDLEPIELLDSIRRHADRITVFHQAGQAGVPTARRLFAYLEDCVVAVEAPNGGVFHPKLWVLRYRSRSGESCLRILCASRNLTFDRSWDTLLRLDSAPPGDPSGRGDDVEVDVAEVARLVEALPGLAVQAVTDDRQREITDLVADLRATRFSGPPGVGPTRFHAIGIDPPSSPPFPHTADRLLVVSPFLQVGLLGRLPATKGDRFLVSRSDQLDQVGAKELAGFTRCFVLDDAAELTDADAEVAPTGKVRTAVDDPEIALTGLHAKLFVFDRGDTTTVLAGSANATNAAFATNVELAAEFAVPTARAGVLVLLEPGEKGEPAFGRLLAIHEPADDPIDAGDSPVDERLEALRRGLGGLRCVAEVEVADDASLYNVRYRSESAIGVDLEGVELRCWPVTAPGSASLVSSTPEAPLDATFTVSFDALTSFLAIQLSCDDVVSRFIVPCRMTGAPSDRRSRLLRVLLGDAGRFLRYLLMLLADESSDERFDLEEMLDRLDRPHHDADAGSGTAGIPLLEALLRALARDPSRLVPVDRLVEELSESDEGRALLPEDFAEVWEPIRSVAAELRDPA